ncbi:MAG: UDP-N-acetylglucosamine 2-epimerase [Phycisphaerales bacterium]
MPRTRPPTHTKPRTVAVITGSRAEFGLLRPVMDAIAANKHLRLRVIAAGSHMLPPARTIREVEAAYTVAARVPMQRAAHATRADDATAVARGIYCFTRVFAKLKPDWVVVLGDRTEAFAAASAASIAGLAVCHIHGGDRAEGIADEAMRHAITKLAHLHCAATAQSASRIIRMGERPQHVHITGSPAIDGLRRIRPLAFDDWLWMDLPMAIFLLHPSGQGAAADTLAATSTLHAWERTVGGRSTLLLLEPNHDAGRGPILKAMHTFAARSHCATLAAHMPRDRFVALLKRMREGTPMGMLIGNSSAGLIECAALGVPAVNIGPRQAGREQGKNVVNVPTPSVGSVSRALFAAARLGRTLRPSSLFGTGRAGPRIAALLASTDPHAVALLRKRNAY